jgi:tetratricopeptide (TPR) repeat protein
MIQWLGQLVALPLKVLLILVSIVPVFDRLPLYRAIWALTRDPYYARNLILLLAQRRGMEAARSFAEEAFAACPDGSIAAMIGQLELDAALDLDRALSWQRRARKYPGLRNPDGLLLLELFLGSHIPNLDIHRIVESILARNDLSMDLTRMALFAKAQLDLKAGRWDQALQIANHVLSISEIPLAHWILWVAYSALQEPQLVSREFQRLSLKTLGPLYDAIMARGYLYLGDRNRCREHLLRCRQAGIPDGILLLNEPDLAGPLAELPPVSESSEVPS